MDMSIEDKIVLEKMLEAMCIASGFERADLLGVRRTPPRLCACRYFIWYHLYHDKRWSLSEVGQPFKRDHVTILHGIRKTDDIISTLGFEIERNIYDEFINNLCVLL